MKYIVISMVIFVFLNSCKSNREKENIEEIMKKVETHLSPAVRIEGEPEILYTIDERMKYYNVPGLSIAVIFNGKLQWAKGYGFISVDSTRKIDQNTMFQAASISKPVTAMASLYLVQEGKLSLDTDVNSYITGWKIIENRFTKDEKVTVRRLLSHSAGITVNGFRGYAKGEEIPDLIQILNGDAPANSDPIIPDTIPGQIYRYSGGGYTILQKIMTDISGIPFEELMHQTVLSKLGMDHSTFYQPLPEKFYENASIGHERLNSPIEGNWHTYPEMAAAGLWTTPKDLANFIIEVQQSNKGLSNRILSQKNVKLMVSRDIEDQGLGFEIHGEGDSIRFGHGGFNEGFTCQLIAFTNLGQGAIIMTNSNSGWDLIEEIFRSISDTYNWNIYSTIVKKIVQLDSQKLNMFTGNYESGDGLLIEFYPNENALVVKQYWNDVEYKIYPESELIFFDKESSLSFIFEKADNGTIKSFLVNNLNFTKTN